MAGISAESPSTVAIPFSSGHHSYISQKHIWRVKWAVAIPFSSGHHSYGGSKMETGTYRIGRNPFFIRSSFLRWKSRHLHHTFVSQSLFHQVIIPTSSDKLLCLSELLSQSLFHQVIIPTVRLDYNQVDLQSQSLFHQVIIPTTCWPTSAERAIGRNPFFIRSSFLLHTESYMC